MKIRYLQIIEFIIQTTQSDAWLCSFQTEG